MGLKRGRVPSRNRGVSQKMERKRKGSVDLVDLINREGANLKKRDQILKHIEVAAYEGDQKRAIRLYVENRISCQAFRDAVAKGQERRKKEGSG